MLDEVFLHVGMHKTGSSTIQIALDGYDDGTTFYADLGRPNHSLALRTIFDPYPEQIDTHVLQGRSAAEVERLRTDFLLALDAQVERSGSRMILSGEGVCDLADEGITAMRDWLVSHAKKVTVFAYVREPIAFVNSYFAESVKHDLTEFDIPTPEYARRLGRFCESFSDEDVVFHIFDSGNFEGGSLLADFCKTADLDSSRLSEEMRSNESLPLEAVQILFLLNRYSENRPKDAAHVHTLRNIRKAFLESGQSKFRLCGDLVQVSIDQKDLAWFEAETKQHVDANKIGKNSEGCVRNLEDLLSLRPETKALLFKILDDRGIFVSQDNPDQALARLYDTFHAEEVGPRHKSILKKFRKKLGV